MLLSSDKIRGVSLFKKSKAKLSNKLYMSFGKGMVDDQVVPIFEKGTVYPARKISSNNGLSKRIRGGSCQDERIRFSKNSIIGILTVENLLSQEIVEIGILIAI
jgi:hypothetical protein